MRKTITLLLILLLVLSGLPGPVQTAGQDARPFKTGLTVPTEREKELFAKTAKVAEQVLPNSEGLARINENRKAKGLPLLSGDFAALDSDAIVTADNKKQSEKNYAVILENYQSLLDSLPSLVDLSTSLYFPAIGDQGQLGSCASFSSTYYAATYQTAARRGIDLTANPDRILSPRFTYNLNNDGEDTGSSLDGNLLTLYTRGAPFADEASMINYQYDGYDYISPGVIDPLQYREYPQTAAIYNDALRNRISDFGLIEDAGTAAGLDQICQMLNNGHVLLFATDYINGWKFDKPVADDPATIGDDEFAGQRASYGMVVPNPDDVSRHAMTVVGYNKDIWVDIDGDGSVDSYEKGALKIANSWGADWMNGGFVWLSFNALQDANGHLGVIADGVLIYLVAQDTYVPLATAEITVNTARRNELWLFSGVNWSEAGEPIYAYSDYVFSGHWGGPYSFAGTTSASTATVVVDLSDAIAGEGFADAGGKVSLFAGVGDDMSGSMMQRVDSIVYKASETVATLDSLPFSVNNMLRWFTGKAMVSAADPPAYDPGVETLPVLPGGSKVDAWSSGPDEAMEWQYTPGTSGYYKFSNSLGALGAVEILNDSRNLLYVDDGTGMATVPLFAGRTYCLRAWYAGMDGGASFSVRLDASNPIWPNTEQSAQLSALTLSSSEPLSPAFSSGTYRYNAQVTAGFTLQVQPVDPSAYVVTGGRVGNSREVLLEENNTVMNRVVVTSRDWLLTKVYWLQATRGTCSALADLANLTLTSGTWDQPFAASMPSYHVTLPEENGVVTLAATAADTKATVFINGIRRENLDLEVLPGNSRTLTIQILAQDLVSSRTYTVVLARPGRFEPGAFPVDLSLWTPSETAVSPAGSLIFLADAVGKRIQAVDLAAGTFMTSGMPYKPKNLTWAGGMLIATLSTPEYGSDLLAEIDPVSGRIIRTIPVGTDVHRMATDGTHVFVYGNDYLKSYDLESGSLLSNSYSGSIYDMEYNPVVRILFTTGYNSSNAYRVVDGALTFLDSTTQRANETFTLMPDGQHLLLDLGVVLTCSDQADTNLEYVTLIPGSRLVVADPENNELYVVSERLIHVYSASDFSFRRVIPQPRETQSLFVSDGRLITAEEADSLLVFRQTGARTLLQSVKIDGDFCSELYPLQQTITGPELPYSTASVLIDAQAAYPGSAVSGDVGTVPLAVGENSLSITVSDPLSGDIRTYTLTVTRLGSDPLPPSADARTNLGFTPLDMALDPERPVAYLTAPSSCVLYRVNLETGEIQTKTFALTAERLVVKNGKIYLTLLRSGHQYWDNTYLNGYGAVAVVDTATFQTEFIFNTNIDPYDITADEAGRVFLAPGSNQHSILAAYASGTGQFWSSINSVYFESFIDRNPVSGKLYTISTSVSPRDIDAYEVNDGVITVNYDSPYHGTYEMSTFMRVSPDGQLIFNGSGNLFASTPTQSGDMVYTGTLGSAYTSLAFDLAHNRFYTGSGKTFKAYAYDSRTLLWTFTAADDFITMEHDGSQVISAQKKSNGEYYMRTFAPDTLLSTLKVGGSTIAGFNPLTQTYTLNVSTDVSSLLLSATAFEGGSLVSGDLGTVTVNPGTNTFQVTVSGASSGLSRVYTLQVNRNYIPVTGIWLDYGRVNFPVGNSMTLAANILPSNATDSRVTWSSSDSSIASVDQSGKVTGLAAGEAVITAHTVEGGFTSSCEVQVLPAVLFVADYEIDSINRVLKDISINTSVTQLKTHLANNPDLLKVYDSSGSEYTGNQVASGMTLKLVIGGEVCDQLTLSVFGDVSGDGVIDITDILYIRADILDTYTLQPWQAPAADINRDGIIDITDILYVRAHILETYTIHAK